MPAVEDYELWIRIAEKYPIAGVGSITFIKHMPEGSHVSTAHRRVFEGYIQIYQRNKKAYQKNRQAKTAILYNIVRQGVMAKTIHAIPYGWTWLCSKILQKVGG